LNYSVIIIITIAVSRHIRHIAVISALVVTQHFPKDKPRVTSRHSQGADKTTLHW
jgi:hypothetical protein